MEVRFGLWRLKLGLEVGGRICLGSLGLVCQHDSCSRLTLPTFRVLPIQVQTIEPVLLEEGNHMFHKLAPGEREREVTMVTEREVCYHGYLVTALVRCTF